MNKSIFIIAVSLLFAVGTAVGRPAPDKKTRYIVLAEQARHYVAIADAATQRIVWTWDVSKSGLPAEHRNWFNCPTEIKPVYGGLCILVVSNGGIGLIRIADHRMIWYAASGGGFPHSAEVLPDGNVAVACSTSNTPAGDKLKIYRVDYDRFRQPRPSQSIRSSRAITSSGTGRTRCCGQRPTRRSMPMPTD